MFSNWYLYRAVETRLFRRQTLKQTPPDQIEKKTELASSAPSSESLKFTHNSNEKPQDTMLSSEQAIITNDKVEKVGTCFKHVVEECSKNCSAKELGLTSMPFVKDAVDMATTMAKRPSVQDAILAEALADPNFMKKVEHVGEEIESLQLVEKEDEGESKKELVKDSTYQQIVNCLGRMYNSLGRGVNPAMNWVVDEIMVCFKVAKDVASKILIAIQESFLWVVKAIMDPKGEIKKVLNDPEKPSQEKVLKIVGVFAAAILWVVISQNGQIATRYFGRTVGSAVGAALITIQSNESKQVLSHATSIYNYLKKIQ